MTTYNDPILQLREARPDVAPPTVESEFRARAAMYRHRPAHHGRLIVATVACVIAVIALAVTTIPWSRTQSAEAAVENLVQTAAKQPTLKLGPDDWVVSKYTTRNSWTQNLTQAKLDTLSARAAAVAAAAGEGHFVRRGGSSSSDSEQAKIHRMNQRRIERYRAGVKLTDLPTAHVTAWNSSAYTEAHDASGVGGGAGGNNTIEYGTEAERSAAKILERAGIGGRLANPVDFGGSEIASLPIRAVGDQSRIEKLSTDSEQLRTDLTEWKAVDSFAEKTQAGSSRDLFAKAAGVVISRYTTPGQRAAGIRMAASLPGVTIDQGVKDAKGREGLGMSLAIPGGEMQLIFDQDDSRLLGMVVRITDPKTFVGESYAGSGKDRVDVIPPFDSATISISYDKSTVSRGRPPCGPGFCMTSAQPSQSELKRLRRLTHTR